MGKKNVYTYQQKPEVSCRVEGDNKVILYNPDIDDFIVINSSSLVIWRFLEKSHSVDEIYAHLMESFEAPPEKDVVLQDIMSFLEELENEYICKVEHESRTGTN